eukprot:5202862-Alexandrium_andersonii.AAC.1
MRRLLEKIEKDVRDKRSELDNNQMVKKDCGENDSECSFNIWDELTWQGDQLVHSSMVREAELCAHKELEGVEGFISLAEDKPGVG